MKVLWERLSSRDRPGTAGRPWKGPPTAGIFTLRIMNTHMQFGQLRRINLRRRAGQRTGGGGGLGEGDHLADGILASHQRADAVETEGDAAVRRAAVAQRLQQETEAALRIFFRNAQQFEYDLLHFRAVDTDRAAADFGAVEHHVIGPRQGIGRIGLERFGVTEANWRDGGKEDRNFLESESPLFVGRAVAALAQDPGILERSGQLLSSWELGRQYRFTDYDGRRPDWGAVEIDFSRLPRALLELMRTGSQIQLEWLDAVSKRTRRFLAQLPENKGRHSKGRP